MKGREVAALGVQSAGELAGLAPRHPGRCDPFMTEAIRLSKLEERKQQAKRNKALAVQVGTAEQDAPQSGVAVAVASATALALYDPNPVLPEAGPVGLLADMVAVQPPPVAEAATEPSGQSFAQTLGAAIAETSDAALAEDAAVAKEGRNLRNQKRNRDDDHFLHSCAICHGEEMKDGWYPSHRLNVHPEYAEEFIELNPNKGLCEHVVCAPCAGLMMKTAEKRLPDETAGKRPRRGLRCPMCNAPGSEYVRVIEAGLETIGELRKAWAAYGYFNPGA